MASSPPIRRSSWSSTLPVCFFFFFFFCCSHFLSLLTFSISGCGHCKALAPEYEKAAKTLKGTATLAKVDCTAEADLCGKYVREEQEKESKRGDRRREREGLRFTQRL
jgi:hypothetical protein